MRERDERHALIESCSEERRQIAAMGASQVALRSSSTRTGAHTRCAALDYYTAHTPNEVHQRGRLVLTPATYFGKRAASSRAKWSVARKADQKTRSPGSSSAARNRPDAKPTAFSSTYESVYLSCRSSSTRRAATNASRVAMSMFADASHRECAWPTGECPSTFSSTLHVSSVLLSLPASPSESDAGSLLSLKEADRRAWSTGWSKSNWQSSGRQTRCKQRSRSALTRCGIAGTPAELWTASRSRSTTSAADDNSECSAAHVRAFGVCSLSLCLNSSSRCILAPSASAQSVSSASLAWPSPSSSTCVSALS